MPQVRYRVCYQTVVESQTCVCYRKVYHTVMRECKYTSYKKCYEQRCREEKYTVCKPVWEDYDVVRKFTVCRPVYEQHFRECRYTVHKPCWEEYDVVRKFTVYKPCYEQHVKECRYTTYKPCWQEYQVPVEMDDLSTLLRAAREDVPVHGLSPVLAGISGAREVDHLSPGAAACMKRASAPSTPCYKIVLAGDTRCLPAACEDLPVHGVQAVLAGVPGAGEMDDHRQVGAAREECCYTVHKPCWQEYQVPVKYYTCKPVYEQQCLPGADDVLPDGDGAVPAGVQDVHVRAGLDGAVLQGVHRDWRRRRRTAPARS